MMPSVRQQQSICTYSFISVDGSEDNNTIIIITGGVLGASIILVFIVIVTVGAIIFVLRHKHKEKALNRGMPWYTKDYCI